MIKKLYKLYAWLMWLPYWQDSRRALKVEKAKKEDELTQLKTSRSTPGAKKEVLQVEVKKMNKPIQDNEQDFIDWRDLQ
tara:strand:+ start:209 stop:445 length:237 start_codon:yes stop_codon:yes gene_type:complete